MNAGRVITATILLNIALICLVVLVTAAGLSLAGRGAGLVLGIPAACGPCASSQLSVPETEKSRIEADSLFNRILKNRKQKNGKNDPHSARHY
jgi:hypothetical protein